MKHILYNIFFTTLLFIFANQVQAHIAFDAVSESHSGTSGSVGGDWYQWTHTPVGTPKGVIVFVFTIGTSPADESVTYGSTMMSRISEAEAVDSAGEPGMVRTYFLGSNIPTGARTVLISRFSNTNESYAVAYTVTAATQATELYIPGIVLLQEDGAYSEQNVNDGSPGSNSLRFAAAYYGANNVPSAGSNTTTSTGMSIDIGSYTCSGGYETTAGQGSRPVGFSASSDDRAAVHLAVREIIEPTPTRTPTPTPSFYNCTSNTASGNWNSSTSWTNCNNTTPRTVDRVTIANGHTISLNTDAEITHVNIQNGGTLTTDNNSRTLTLTGTSGSLFIKGATGTFTAGNSTVVMNPDAAVTMLSGTPTFNELTLSPTLTADRTYTVGAGLTAANFTINPASDSTYRLTVNMSGNSTITNTTLISGTSSALSTLDPRPASTNYNLTTGNLNLAAAGTLDFTGSSSTLRLTGTSGTIFTRTGTFTKGSSTVIVSGTGNVTLNSGTLDLNNLTITGNRTIAFSHLSSVAVTGILTLTGTSCNNPLYLVSTSPGSSWTLNASGITSLSFLNVTDGIATTPITSTSSIGTNTSGWMFTEGLCNPPDSTSSEMAATQGSPQRKTFYDTVNERYWTFYYTGASIGYSNSADGITFTGVDHLPYNTADFSLFYKKIGSTSYVVVASACYTYDICYSLGVLNPDYITFFEENIVFDGTSPNNAYSSPNISISSDNHVWVAAQKHAFNSTLSETKYLIATTKTISAFTTDFQTFDTTTILEHDYGEARDINLIPQQDGKMMVITGNNSHHLFAWLYSNSTWNSTGTDYAFLTFGNSYINGFIYAMAIWGNDIYLGGEFDTITQADGTTLTVNNIVRYSTLDATFYRVGYSPYGVNGPVYALAATENRVYIGGNFSTAGSSSKNNITYLSFNDFQFLGLGEENNGVNGPVHAIAITGEDVYIGGNFTSAVSLDGFNNIARYVWDGMGGMFLTLKELETGGVGGPVNTIAISGTNIYIGGTFSSVAGVNGYNYLARYVKDELGGQFYTLGSGATKGVNSSVNTIVVVNDNVYLGGHFTTAGGAAGHNYITRYVYDGSGGTFNPLGSGGTKGVDGSVSALFASGDDLFVGGSFTAAGGSSGFNHIARYIHNESGGEFYTLGSGETKGFDESVTAIAMKNNMVYIGGYFTAAGGNSTNSLAIYAPAVTANVGANSKISAVSDSSGNVYLTYTKSDDNDLYMKRLDAGTGLWGSEVAVHTGSVDSVSLTLDPFDANKLYAIYQDTNHLYVRTTASPYTDWSIAEAITSSGINRYPIAGFETSASGEYYVMWTEGSESPYNVMFYLNGAEPAEPTNTPTLTPTFTPTLTLTPTTAPTVSPGTGGVKSTGGVQIKGTVQIK